MQEGKKNKSIISGDSQAESMRKVVIDVKKGNILDVDVKIASALI